MAAGFVGIYHPYLYGRSCCACLHSMFDFGVFWSFLGRDIWSLFKYCDQLAKRRLLSNIYNRNVRHLLHGYGSTRLLKLCCRTVRQWTLDIFAHSLIPWLYSIADHRSRGCMGGPICLWVSHICPHGIQDCSNQKITAIVSDKLQKKYRCCHVSGR